MEVDGETNKYQGIHFHLGQHVEVCFPYFPALGRFPIRVIRYLDFRTPGFRLVSITPTGFYNSNRLPQSRVQIA